MTERAVVGVQEMAMGNQSTGTESVVSTALASPFDERNIPVPSIIPQWLKLVRLNGETRIHHLLRKDQSSTGTPDAVKVARPVWMRGKSASSYLCIRDDNH